MRASRPLDQADLTDDEAYDVAAYVAHARPVMVGLERDYPDRATKPVDCPYPPYADPFPQEQHRLGPFAPIRAYYAQAAGPKTTPSGGAPRIEVPAATRTRADGRAP